MGHIIIKCKILKMLKSEAATWDELSAKFEIEDLYYALKSLKALNYIDDDSPDNSLGSEYHLLRRNALSVYICSCTSVAIVILGCISSILTVLAFIR